MKATLVALLTERDSVAFRRFRWAFTLIVIGLFVIFGFASGAPPVLPALAVAAALVTGTWLMKERIPKRVRPRSKYDLLMLFWVTLFATAAVLDYTVNLPIAETERARIVSEFDSFAQMPASQRLTYDVYTKPNSVLVEGTYRAVVKWSDLRTHFDSVLAADGWTFAGERTVGEGGDASQVACYGKGNETAEASLPLAGSGSRYSFSVFWNLGHRPAC